MEDMEELDANSTELTEVASSPRRPPCGRPTLLFLSDSREY
jgi:hypothetical protein